MRQPGLQKRALLGGVAVFLLLLVVGTASFISLRQMEAALARVAHTQDVRRSLEALMALVADGESAQRGYLLTGDSAYLGPFYQADAAAERQLVRLQSLTADDSAQTRRLTAVAALVVERLTRLHEAEAVRERQGLAAAIERLRISNGRALMGRIRAGLLEMDRAETATLAERQVSADAAAVRARLIALLAAIAAAIVAIGGGWQLHRDLGLRLAAEQAVAAERAHLAAILNTVRDGILVTDATGRVVAGNPAAARLFGYADLAALEGIASSTLGFAELPRADTTEEMAIAAREIQGRRRDGTTFPAAVATNAVHTGGPPLFTTVVRDLTGQRRLESAREASEQRYLIAASVMAEGVVVQNADGVVVDCNNAAETILGLPREQILRLGDPDWKWAGIHEDGRPFPRSEHPALIALRTGLPVRNVVLGLPRNDRDKWLLINSAPMRGRDGKVNGVVSSFTDITRRREAEQRLREEEARLRDFLDNASDLILSTDGSGIVRYANRAFFETLGFTAPADVLGKPVSAFLDASCRDQCMLAFARVMSGEQLAGLDATFVAADGRLIHVQGNSNARFEQGRPVATRSIFRDITELRVALDMVVQARDAAEEASRTKSEFLANMSHELRTPLNSVIGFANVLLKNKGGHLSAQDLQYLQRIHDNGRHLLSLINSVLDLSKIEAGRMELELTDVDLGALVRDTLDQLHGHVAGRPIALVADVAAGLRPLHTDGPKLKQVLINLVGNALKFTERGEVRVRVAAGDDGIAQRLDVVDTGIGIPADRLAAVFEAFHQADNTTSRKYGGTGLGLSITRSLVHLMGYEVTVESEPGSGSTFSVHFRAGTISPGAVVAPAAHARSRDLLPALATAPGVDGVAPVVLIIDDDPDARLLLAQFIHDFGASTVTAASGTEGLRLARELRPALITLDIMMPEMTGIEVLVALKQDPALAAIPVAIVSIIASDQRGEAINAVALIDKPVSREELEAVLRTHLAVRRSTPQLRDELNRLVDRYTRPPRG